MLQDITVAGIRVAPGEQRRGSLPVLNLADSSDMSLPLLLVNGAKDGPKIYLGAAIHGDEVNGIAILARALAQVDPSALSGQ